MKEKYKSIKILAQDHAIIKKIADKERRKLTTILSWAIENFAKSKKIDPVTE